jgi:thymidylate synthase (FAD)
MHFLGLRTHNENANHVSYPMWEIEQMANAMEEDFRAMLPLTWAAWNEFGRESP